jgi:integration host factor subunit beta
MTRSDLIAALASRFPNLMAKDAEVAVKEILDAIGQSLVRRNRVEIRGFGSFSLNYRPARTGRNPKNGETVSVPAKYAPHFKAGKEMRECVEQSAKSLPIQRAA